jgi:Arylsulfatase A and related enzymes
MTRIALVVLDTLRKDTFDDHFDWLPGRYYSDAVSTSHWTIAAHTSMFTGRYPGELGVNMKNPDLVGFDAPVLAERLQSAGFQTRALTANHYLAYSEGWDRGFDEFYTPWHLQNQNAFNTTDLIGQMMQSENAGIKTMLQRLYVSDKSAWHSLVLLLKMTAPGVTHGVSDDGAKNVLSWVNSNASSLTEDEFLYVNLMEAHTPLNPPTEYNSADASVGLPKRGCFAENVQNADQIQTAYDDAARYLSDIYRDIFDRLKESYDYIVTCADHGQALGERTLRNRFNIWGHSYGLYPELVQVPLVISGSGLNGRDNRPVSLIDIPATIAELSGVDDRSRGIPLIEDREPGVQSSDADFESRSRLTQYHGFDSFHKKKYLRNEVLEATIDDVDTKLEGIATGSGYAWETHDQGLLVNDSPDAPKESLDTLSDSVTERTGDDIDREFSDRVLDQLEELGYV